MLYLRHSHKLYNNRKHFDSPLTFYGILYIYKKIDEYIIEFGLPSKLITSPYLRTRQTAKIIQYYIKKKFTIEIEIIIEPLLSEYINKDIYSEISLKSFDYKTLLYNPIIGETYYEFLKRINRIKNLNFSNNEWIITHNYNIQKIFNIKKNIKYFHGIYIKYTP